MDQEPRCPTCRWAKEIEWKEGSFLQCWRLPASVLSYPPNGTAPWGRFPSVNANSGCPRWDDEPLYDMEECQFCQLGDQGPGGIRCTLGHGGRVRGDHYCSKFRSRLGSEGQTAADMENMHGMDDVPF